MPSQALQPQKAIEVSWPFKKFIIDLGKQKGTNYLIGADRNTGWPMVAPLPNVDTKIITDMTYSMIGSSSMLYRSAYRQMGAANSRDCS